MGTNPQTPAPTHRGETALKLPPAPRQGSSPPSLPRVRQQSHPSRSTPRAEHQNRLPLLAHRARRRSHTPPLAPWEPPQIRPPTDPLPAPHTKRRTLWLQLPPTSWTRFPPRGTKGVPAWTEGHWSACPHPLRHPNPHRQQPHHHHRRHRHRHHRRRRCLHPLLDLVLPASAASPIFSAPLPACPTWPRCDSSSPRHGPLATGPSSP